MTLTILKTINQSTIMPKGQRVSVLLLLVITFNSTKLTDPCESEIYCKGQMYQAIQKTITENFVNKKLLVEPEDATSAFQSLMGNTSVNSNQSASTDIVDDDDDDDSSDNSAKIEDFIEKYFEDEQDDVDYELWQLPDKNFVNMSKNINDRNLALFVNYLTNLLPRLAVKGTNQTLHHRNRYSILSATGFIKRHKEAKEAFYWETYWVANSFLLMGMLNTARTIVDNLISMVVQFGFVPKANRVYYSQRSNPPFLTLMAYNYFSKSNNYDWLQRNIKYLDKELMFWINNRSIIIEKNNKSYHMFRYIVECYSPRPEAFQHDENLAEETEDKEMFYREIHSASESGWDLSSRWLVGDKGNVSTELTDLNVTRVIPVDLNAYLYKNFAHIARLYSVLTNNAKRAFWQSKAEDLKVAIASILWNHKEGMWNDFDIELQQHRSRYFITNFMPLWAKAFPENMAHKYGEYANVYLTKYDLITKYKGCIPDSLTETSQSFDYPNSHTHLVVMVIQGLKNTKYNETLRKASILLVNWMDAVMSCWAETQNIFDVYSAEVFGEHVSYQEWNEDHSVTIGAFLDTLDNYYVIEERHQSNNACGRRNSLLTIIIVYVCSFKLIQTRLLNY